MSATLMAKLKKKTEPIAHKRVAVGLAKKKTKSPAASLVKATAQAKTTSIKPSGTKVLDKRGENKVNRIQFMTQLGIAKPSSVKQKPLDTVPASVTTSVAPKERTSVAPKERTSVAPKELTSVAPKKTTIRRKKLKLVTKRESKKTSLLGVDPEKPTLSSKKKSTIAKKPLPKGIPLEVPASMLKIGDTVLKDRLGPPKEPITLNASAYYAANREIFVNFVTSLFGKYKKDLAKMGKEESCSRDDSMIFEPMAHQKIVRDYISLYTPYRGLLLYHGLGSGKTCSSIAIAEGLKTAQPIIVMIPASLRMNYIEELKKCGDSLYRKNQFWEFIPSDTDELIDAMSSMLSLPREFIRKNRGAWVMNVTKEANFETLSAEQKKSLDAQLNEMIKHKYTFINYNGLRAQHLKDMTDNYKRNPFDNAVIIIDEAHNLVGRIVNKLKKPDSLSMRIYEYLLSASNARVVALTGTPMINYPNELGVLFNILRGYIRSWSFKLNTPKKKKITQKTIESMFKSTVKGGNITDLLEYKASTNTLTVTRNPFGFVNKVRKGMYDGMRVSSRGNISDTDFVSSITKLLLKDGIEIIPSGTQVTQYKALPDTLEEFQSFFIDDSQEVKNMELFKRRILGLASYFKDMEGLMPRYNKSTDFNIVKIPMSDFQFGVYEEARVQERKLELRNAKKRKQQKDQVFEDTVSTYRIFSRAFCNFVFPKPDIKRPLPGKDEELENVIATDRFNENDLDAATVQQRLNTIDNVLEQDEVVSMVSGQDDYEERVKEALSKLDAEKDKYLQPDGLETYSPKFLRILETLESDDNIGLNLIYSQFRTLEGVGILKLVLEANGYQQLKLKKIDGRWTVNIGAEDSGSKKRFALYTGTESAEEKELLRNIYNSTWEYLPPELAEQLKGISENNQMGDIVKVLMITASGAEGISLRNVRYVHILEPYWHPVRLEQVIGRARRICSHHTLPEKLQTVEVFLYLMTFSKKQLESDDSIELRLKDKSRIDRITPVTSDEHLYEIASAKAAIATKLLEGIKEASIDCSLHNKPGDKDGVRCFTFGSPKPSKFSYLPAITDEEPDYIAQRNKTTVKIDAVEVEYNGITYAYDKTTGALYDLESYKNDQPVKVADLIITKEKGKKPIYVFKPI